MKSRLRFLTFALALFASAAAHADGDPDPASGGPGGPGAVAVLELFGSQGCSSCPPANTVLAELCDKKNVVALSYHVGYWDYIGWKDPYAIPEATDRQRAYVERMGGRYVYTPQMVVDGRWQGIGSDRRKVAEMLAHAVARPKLAVSLAGTEGAEATVRVPAAPHAGAAADIWLVAVDDRRITKVARGENAGRSLVNNHIVRSITRAGSWTGEAIELAVSLGDLRGAGHDAVAILVQEPNGGPILGAAFQHLPKR